MRTSVRPVLAVVACGCNAVFGLDPTQQRPDYLDGPADAAFTCPPAGSGPPRFSRSFRQVVLQPCSEYTASAPAGRALAICIEGMPGMRVIEEGAIDDQMSPALGLQDVNLVFSYPRLGPDGDVAVAEIYDRVANARTYELLGRSASGWTRTNQLSPGFGILSTTAPTRTSPRRMIALGPLGLHELIDDGGGWTDRTTFTFAELGLVGLGYELNWTPDGLHLVFNGELAGGSSMQLLYSDRATLDDRFSTAVALPDVDFLVSGFMTEDCGRVYFSAFGSVFYAPRSS